MQYRVRPKHGGAARPVRVPVLLRNISCEGVSLEFREGARPELRDGTPVTLEFATTGGEMSLPGHVAWQRSNLREEGRLGIGFRLELAPADTRQRYAEWIVALTQQALALRHASRR